MIVAGEASGDSLGAELVHEIKTLEPEISFWGFGGDTMSAEGVEIVSHISELSVMGIIQVIRHIPKMFERLDKLAEDAVSRETRGAVLIDYPDFNLRLAKRLHKAGIPVVYYVSPQIWAWRMGRIRKIKKYVEKMLAILPFEEKIYKNKGVPVSFVGHPFLDSVKPQKSPEDFKKENMLESPLLLLLPGSRKQEVESLIEPMIEAFQILKKKIENLNGAIIIAKNLPENLFEKALGIDGLKLVRGSARDAMFASTAAICCSGSATLECAVAGIPHVIVYRTDRISAFIFKSLIRTKFIGLSNLVAGYEIAPELLLEECNPERLSNAVFPWLTNDEVNQQKRNELSEIKAKLGSPGASRRAAQEIVEIFSRK